MREEPTSSVLPITRTRGGYDFNRLVWYLFGPPGIGKSTFAAAMPGPLFLYTDPGARGMDAYKAPVGSWPAFKKLVDDLVAGKPDRYGTVVVDTVDILFRMCRKHVCAKRGIEHVSDESYGKGYDLVHDEFEQQVARLSVLDYGLVFVSHSKEVEIRGRSIRTSKIVPSTPRSAHTIVAAMADVIGYCGYAEDSAGKEGAERLVIFEPSETLEVKDRTGLLPARCRLDWAEVSGHLKRTGAEAAPKERNPLRKKKKVAA